MRAGRGPQSVAEQFSDPTEILDELRRFLPTGDFTLGRGASFDIADARIMNYTQVNAPSATGNAAYQAEVKNRYIRVDDGTRARVLVGADGAHSVVRRSLHPAPRAGTTAIALPSEWP